MTQPITIVVGGQWGSEAKGAVAAALCQRMNVDYAVRTGGVNAGHTVYFDGKPMKMQQLPTGWINPGTKLVIGPGAYVNRDILKNEIEMINRATGGHVENRLEIDPRAGTHHSGHTGLSTISGRHHSIGATGKGCSEAVISRIRARGSVNVLYGGDGPDTERLLNDAYDDGARILLEGTQGQGLDILLGPWPYTTHKPTGPAQWLVEAGLSPNLKLEIVMVARTYPIRVAGNSGPMPQELSWHELCGEKGLLGPRVLEYWRITCQSLANDWAVMNQMPKSGGLNRQLYTDWTFETWSPAKRQQYASTLSEFHAEVWRRLMISDPDVCHELAKVFEFTTVTKKLRRIARWDHDTMVAMVRQVRPTYMVLTFLNYEFPELWEADTIHDKAMEFIRQREAELGVEIRYVTTGPESHHMLEVR